MSEQEDRIAALERRYLQLEACSIFQTQALGVLLVLLEDATSGPEHRKVPWQQIRRVYSRKLRKETDKFLARISDDNPLLATQLREVLKGQLPPLDEG